MTTSLLCSLAGGFLLTGMFTSAAPAPAQTLQYPAARKSDVVDDYHGTRVPDPYRWLEDPDSPESRAWIEAQNRLTAAYLAEIPARAAIRERLTKLWNYPKYGTPFRKARRYFFFKNDGLQNQSVLYKQASLTADPETLLDPNVLSEDGTVALSTLAVSEDGRLLAYGTSASGSDWEEFRVRDVAEGRDLSDHLKWIKFSGASWTNDGAGFFYSRYPEPGDKALTDVNRFQRLYYHRLGTEQTEDVLVYERPDQPDWGMNAEVTDDGRYAVLHVWLGTDRRNRVYYLDLKDARRPKVTGEVVRLLDDFDASYAFVGNDGPVFYFLTDLQAPRKRVIAIDTRHPERARWREIIPQGPDVLDGIHIIHDTFVANYMHDASSRLRLFTLEGRLVKDLPLPTLGSIGAISGERKDDEMFYAFTSFLYPTTIFRYDFKSGGTSVFKAPTIDFDPSGYETKQVFYTSKDGTRVPMFITHKKGLRLDGSNPTYLYGYGGFNISLTPSFSVAMLVWLEQGGVYAVPNLRGGGEYGEEWHQAGMHDKKQNVFDDFIAAAEYLIAQGYTSPSKLAIAGGSNGGLLVGAAITQRPELFGAALPAVGVMDMLRFHKFTIGWAWVTDYGSADSAAQFPYLYKYSPLHNIRPGTRYPATLVTTAEKAGHGAGKPTSKLIEEQADRMAFLVKNLAVEGGEGR
ncbi:MAG: S9 family peptidase [Gemmatimonadetes bacterium]|nr:MAG: S9 family peptidase [Gemmatimonadota bacterium]